MVDDHVLLFEQIIAGDRPAVSSDVATQSHPLRLTS
jgi:hypothetical protein